MQKNSITNKYQNLVTQINNLEDKFKTFTDNELRAQSFKLKKQYQESKDLNLLIPESFALTREASLRTLGLRHFDVQLCHLLYAKSLFVLQLCHFLCTEFLYVLYFAIYFALST